ncbi:MAG TPA: zf-HC2 domain-containing protein [Acidimicrobiales bacterium]|nr:zf-HC2 domain-containing protein [Acidimicrobiales bacterium]
MSVFTKDLVCQQAVELVTDYLEGVLSRGERRAFERHLEGCDGCAGFLEQVREVLVATGRVGPDDLDPATLDGLVQLYREHRDDPA